MNVRTLSLASRCMGRTAKGQAMSEFLMMAFVVLIILFVAIQMAALGREAMALGQLSYQVTRWATNPGNNSIAGSNSPQCSDITKGGSTTTSCAVQRPAGTAVQVTLSMDTSSVIFLTTSTTNPNFFGIPFPKTLSSTQTMLTQ
jgi:hypothetical protein